MKNLILLCLLVFSTSSAMGQITLTESDFTSLYNTRQEISTYDATSLTGAAAIVAATGANQTWDFTTMTWALDATTTVEYLTDFSGVPAADDPRLSSATVVTQGWEVFNPTPSDTSVFIFQEATSAGVWILALAATGDVDEDPPSPDTLLLINDPKSLDLVFPLTFGTSYSDSTDQTTEVNGTPFLATTFVTDVDVDGWGTLVLPSGSYQALRSFRTEKIKTLFSTTYQYYVDFLTKDNAFAAVEVDTFGVPLAADYEVYETVLPVELVGFNAVLSDDIARLDWETLSEVNNTGFFVEHQRPGGAFADAGFVAGAGSSSERRTYSYEVVASELGTHRFRLRQVDVDGSFVYSPVVEIDANIGSNLVLSAPYPNPFTDTAIIEVSVGTEQRVSVDVFNVLGQRVLSLYDSVLGAGSSLALNVEASALPSGVYVVRMTGRNASVSRTMLVDR